MTSAQPLKDAFRKVGKPSKRGADLALGSKRQDKGVILYPASFTLVLHADCSESDARTGRIIIATCSGARDALLTFSWLSDKIGKERIMMAGLIGRAYLPFRSTRP